MKTAARSCWRWGSTYVSAHLHTYSQEESRVAGLLHATWWLNRCRWQRIAMTELVSSTTTQLDKIHAQTRRQYTRTEKKLQVNMKQCEWRMVEPSRNTLKLKLTAQKIQYTTMYNIWRTDN